ncbi:hypothetical protein [Nonomuraea jabiensis]|uniref:hypothetical protein n=1 Tax=Nonomuraea jabiensis TaxID=882448 RepID=UPI00368F1C4D
MRGRRAVAGVLGLQDPPREDSDQPCRRPYGSGVQVKMMTGDRGKIPRRIGVGYDILPARRIEDSQGEDPAGPPDAPGSI